MADVITVDNAITLEASFVDDRPVAIEGALGAEAPRWSLGPATLNKLLMLNYAN